MSKLVETTEVQLAQISLPPKGTAYQNESRSPSALPTRTIIEALERVAEHEMELLAIATKQIETGGSPNSYLEILRSFLEVRGQLYELTIRPVRDEFLGMAAEDLVLHLSEVSGYATLTART